MTKGVTKQASNTWRLAMRAGQSVVPVWTIPLPSTSAGEVTVTVTDESGNSESLTRTFNAGSQPPDECAVIRAERDALLIENAALAAKFQDAAIKAQATVDALK